MGAHKVLLGHLAAIFTISVWGVTFISTKVLLVDFTPVEIMSYRLVLAALVLTLASPPWMRRDKLEAGSWRGELKMMAAGLCGVTLYFLFQNIALSYTLAANVSVLVSVAPLFTALVSRAFLGEELKSNFFLGFTVAIAGIILIAFNGSLVLKLNPLGDVLSLSAALVWAIYSVLIKQISARETDTLKLTRKVVSYGVLFVLLLLPFFGFRLNLARLLAPESLLNLIFLGVIASAICYVTWNYAVRQLGPVKTSVYIYLIPVVTIVASLLLLKEGITLAAGVGMGLILGGMALSERGKSSD